ncbi:RNA-directed DNA polymerase, eukaryota [Tanacetum coccineum]
MGSYRTKEDDVAKISTSVFITNFPESFSAKELFHSCKQYGHVVDSFIPTKRSKSGKRFGFVRFINVFNEERLVNNLCTVWIDRYKLQANIARFHRPPVNGRKHLPKDAGRVKSSNTNAYMNDNVSKNVNGITGGGNSYMNVVKGQMQPRSGDSQAVPAVVLDDECLLSRDLSKSLLGRVKEFASLANLKMALSNEGFVDIKIQYMGELWVMMEFVTEESIKLFRDNVSVGSWFSQIKQASMDFVTEGRIAWVEIEGIPFKLWSGNTFKRIAAKWGELLDVDDQEEMCFHSKRLCIHTKSGRNISEEFKIIYRGKVFWIRANETPGWVPDFVDESDDEDQNDDDSKDGGSNVHEMGSCGGDSDVEEVPDTLFEKDGQVKNNMEEEVMDKPKDKSKDPFHIYSLLNKKKTWVAETTMLSDCNMEETNVIFSGNRSTMNSKDDGADSVLGQVMGYNMDGCLAQKAKKDWVKELCVRNKVNFLALQETKMENIDLIYVKMCWGNLAFDYVHSDSVGNSGGILYVWDLNSFCKSNATISDYFVMVRGVWRLTGQDLLMIAVYAPHDFKDKQLLFGSVFNVQGANMFNSFITNAGLVEVSLGGSSFTWCHKSATKMRFSKIVEDAWRDCPRDESNAMINMMGKLKYLKTKIREWNKTNMLCVKSVKAKYKVDLEDVEAIIDNGNGNEEVVNKRAEIVNNLQSIDKLHSLEMAQKVKVKWLVEGDENSSFFHGMLNKKRILLNIRGIMIDGIWIDNPNWVKREFFNHFSKRFCKLDPRRTLIQMKYQKCLSSKQRTELESKVTNDEIKRAVWDCGTDKAPGPDSFTFGFYRRFWYIIESDVYDVLKELRPISLIGALYKIIAKNSANRSIVGVLGDIVEKRKQSLIFKVDFEKAYDSVRWDFLDDVLRQWCESNISTLVHVLECFYRASGLRINMSKSKIMGVYVDSDKVKRAALKLGCLILKPPFLYLGLIVGGSMSRVHAWNEVVERVKKRLSKWKMKTLSIGGRLTLLKSVLGSMPIFHMSIFKVPSGVLRTLESIRSHFFNGHDSNSKKASWVNWKKVLAPKERGGLGVSSLYALNRGLMFKWVWRFYTQDSSLWARVIKAIHGDDGKMGVITRAGSKSCWMNIVHETNALLNKGIDLIKFMRIKLGNGQITSFWEDMWSEGDTLKNRYPRIYALESSKSITVGMKVAQPSLAFSFRRAPRGGVEQEQFDEIVALVNDVILAPISDKMTWTLEEVNVHAWKVKSDSLPTRFNISRRESRSPITPGGTFLIWSLNHTMVGWLGW